jgi:hypothetical protein
VPDVENMHDVILDGEEHSIAAAPLAVEQLPDLASYFFTLRSNGAALGMSGKTQDSLLESIVPAHLMSRHPLVEPLIRLVDVAPSR